MNLKYSQAKNKFDKAVSQRNVKILKDLSHNRYFNAVLSDFIGLTDIKSIEFLVVNSLVKIEDINIICQICENRPIFLEILLENKFNPNARDKDGETLLHKLAFHDFTPKNEIELIKTLINKGSDPNQQNNYGLTSLHSAVSHFHNFEVAKLLIQLGACPFILDNEQITPYELIRQKPEKLSEKLKLSLEKGIQIFDEEIEKRNQVISEALKNFLIKDLRKIVASY